MVLFEVGSATLSPDGSFLNCGDSHHFAPKRKPLFSRRFQCRISCISSEKALLTGYIELAQALRRPHLRLALEDAYDQRVAIPFGAIAHQQFLIELLFRAQVNDLYGVVLRMRFVTHLSSRS